MYRVYMDIFGSVNPFSIYISPSDAETLKMTFETFIKHSHHLAIEIPVHNGIGCQFGTIQNIHVYVVYVLILVYV